MVVLVHGPPISSVNKNEQRIAVTGGREQIESHIRAVAVGNPQLAVERCSGTITQGSPFREMCFEIRVPGPQTVFSLVGKVARRHRFCPAEV